MPTPPVCDFDDFTVRHLSRLAQVADLLTGDRPTADRVVVDALLRMYRTWPILTSSKDQPAAARRSLATAYRRSARDRGNAGQSVALELAEDFGEVAEPPQGSDAVWEAVLDLAPRDRTVLVLRLFEELPDSSVADAMRMPALSVSRSARRGLDHVAMTVGLATEDEIAGQQDNAARDRIAAEVAACFRTRHRGEADQEPLLATIRAATLGITPRRSRTRPALLAGAAAVLIVASVVTVRWWPEQPDARAALPALPDFPVAPPGTRLVGYGDVAVAVPAGWAHNAVSCGNRATDTVIYPDAAKEGSCTADVGASSATFTDPPPYPPPFRASPPEQLDRIGGQVLLQSSVARTAAGFEQTVLVPISGFSMVVRSPKKSVVVEIATSVQVVPDGFTVVPPCRGQRLRDASADLIEADLKPVINQASTLSDKNGRPPVTFQSVDSGQLVPTGSRVSLFVPSF